MSDNLNRAPRDFSQYDDMETEQLREILRLDSEAPQGEEMDTEIILYIMEVLSRRNEMNGTEKTALEAFESFKANYLPCPVDETLAAVPAQPKAVRRWPRAVAAVAAVLAVVILGSATAGAFGVDVWSAVAKWTQDTFHFGSPYETSPSEPDKTPSLVYTELRDMLLDYKVTEKLAPTWLPEGYENVEVKMTETPKKRIFLAVYQNGDRVIKIQITDYLKESPSQIEQSEGFQELYPSGGVDYYIFADYEQLQAAWKLDYYECYISGPVTIDELKAIIDSIEKG